RPEPAHVGCKASCERFAGEEPEFAGWTQGRSPSPPFSRGGGSRKVLPSVSLRRLRILFPWAAIAVVRVTADHIPALNPKGVGRSLRPSVAPFQSRCSVNRLAQVVGWRWTT